MVDDMKENAENLQKAVLEKNVSKREFLRYSSGALAATIGVVALPPESVAKPGPAIQRRSAAHTWENSDSLVFREAENLTHKEIVDWLVALRGHPFVEQSHFDVTSVLKVRAGGRTFYTAGVNVENIELTVGTCAEEGALGTAITAFGEHADVLEAWVMGAPRDARHGDLSCYPCGECRQRLAQYMAPSAPVHIISRDGNLKDTKTRAELLPMAFSFRDLKMNNGFATPSQKHGIPPLRKLYRQPAEPLTNTNILGWMQDLHSDARVSGADRRVVLRLDNGAYVAGVKLENAAYPSSTTSVQNAVALMNARFGNHKIMEVWTQVTYREPAMNKKMLSVFPPFSGAVVQVLYQFAAADDIPVNIFNIRGEVRNLPLKSLISGVRTFSKFTSG